MYSIKAITTLTGLTAETLRAWERRYDCITPKRSTNGRRSYSQQDLEKLKLLISLTRNGHTIGKIAKLSCEELRAFHAQASERNDHRQSNLFNQIFAALLDYRIEHCEQLLKRALLIYEPLDYIKEVVLPVLHEVGQLWHDEKINSAQEHMLSACIKRILLTLVNSMHQPSANNPSMLFATPSGEQHEFGILIGCLIAASLHYTCYYLGPDLPAADIIDASHHLNPDIVVIDMVNSPPRPQTSEHLETLLYATADSKSKIWLAGLGSAIWLKNNKSIPNNYTLITDITHFHHQAQQLQL